MVNEITPLVEQTNNNTLLDQYEYDPKFYGLEEIECAELTANNVCEMLREEMEHYTKRVMLEFENKLRDTDTLHIFCKICHQMWAEIDSIQKYYFDECDKTRDAILEKMKCNEASKHFEDYMNKPISSTKYVRDEIKKNHFSSMFGKMLTPESGTRQTHALPYVDTDSVIDGTDKTLCMYDYAKELVEMSDDMIDYCKRIHNGKDEGECAMCTEVLCSKSGVNNK